MLLTANELPSRNMPSHSPTDSLNETCEKFFQIWSHKAANISNDLIEYTIRRMQSDRLRFLFQTHNESNNHENVTPICQISIHIEDDLQGIKEHIRRFCLSTRNVYRHLRSDSRIYPKMSIELDQGIMIKICRFIFKTKILIEILSKEQHLSEQQREQLNKNKIKQIDKKFQVNDPYRNITKAFIVLQSNFEILYGDILDRDFFQNAKTAVQTLPIILDISKTIRLVFCQLYKLSEPERQAEAEAVRQRRLAFCVRGYGAKKPGFITTNIPIKNKENIKLKTTNEVSKITHTSTTIPPKTLSADKSINQLKPKKIESSKRIQSPNKSQSRTSNRKISKINKNHLSPSISKRNDASSRKSSTTVQKKHNKTKSPRSKNKMQKKSKNHNKNASTTDSTSSNKYTDNTISINNYNNIEKFKNTNSNHSHTSSKKSSDWTTWLHNATLDLATLLPSNQTNLNTNSLKPLLTTWASLNRISKI